MSYVLLGSVQSFFLGILLFFTSLFLIFIVLIQRGRGGGLTGALGGTGQSAFGSRAGDELTYITLVVAGGWIFLCIVCIWVMNPPDSNTLIGDDAVQTDTDSGGAGDGLLGGGSPSSEDTPSSEGTDSAGDGTDTPDSSDEPGTVDSTDGTSSEGEETSTEDEPETSPDPPPDGSTNDAAEETDNS